MLNYDKNKNIMYIYQSGIARPELEIKHNDNSVYLSYRKYMDTMIKDDIMSIFLPAFKNVLKVGNEKFDIHREDIYITQEASDYFPGLPQHVRCRFDMNNFDYSKVEAPTIIALPKVYENGIIEHEGNEYAFIHMLEQEPTVSYEANENNSKPQTVKIKLGRRYILIEDGKKLSVKFSDVGSNSSKTKYSLMSLIANMCKEEGFDAFETFNEFANFFIKNMFKDDTDKIMTLEYYGGNTSAYNAIEYVTDLTARLKMNRIKYNGDVDTSYDASDVRDQINKLLSLDRAIGETLAKDVESYLNPGRVLATAGTVLDSSHIRVFQSEGVYNIYVKNVPTVEGMFLAEDVRIMCVPAGLKITPNLRQHFPDEKGMYTSKVYDTLAIPIIYEAGTPITQELINTVVAFGYDSIKVSEKKGGLVKVLNFYEEIMSNRQFIGNVIGEESGEWYYLDSSKNFVKNNGDLTAYDFVALYSFCVKLFEGKWYNRVVNSDSGFRKRLVPLHEQFHRAFVYAVTNGMSQMSRKFRSIYEHRRIDLTVKDRIDNEFYAFTSAFWTYLRDEAKCITQLSNDNICNPIAYQSALTKVNVFTASKHSLTDNQRFIAIGSYGKIDACEIPQSHKMGAVYNSTCNVKIDEDGKILTGYYELKHLGNKTKIMKDNPVYLSVSEEENEITADICSLGADENGIVADNNKNVLCRVPALSTVEKQVFANRPVHDVHYVNMVATQPLSWATSTIPFMNCNDSARAIFAVAQEKQAKGLVTPEEPIVMTSAYEQFVWLNDKFGVIAKERGFIDYVRYDRVKGVYNIGVIYESQGEFDSMAVHDEGTIYTIPEYLDSGYSVTVFKILVTEHQIVEKGQMIVSSNFINERGILTIGTNALVGMYCDGYNYEDGVHIAMKMCDKLSSYRINKEEISKNPNTTKAFRVNKVLKSRWLSPKLRSTVEVAFKDPKYNNLFQKEGHSLKKVIGFYEGEEPLTGDSKHNHYGSKIKTVSADKFGGGDKLSNRHGNKGTLSKLEPTENMPRLRNGMPLDLTNNPLGVGSRMNIGQINDMQLGLVGKVLNTQFSTDAYNSVTSEELMMLMSLTVDLMNSTDSDVEQFYSMYLDKVGEDFINHCRANINSIRIWRGCFNKRGTTKLIRPNRGGKLTETEVLIGYMYVFKLVQESAKKLHARGGETLDEPYGELTNAPTSGSANGGGQRLGTMEIDALGAYGISSYVNEALNIRCDNAIARNNFYVDTYLPKNIQDVYRINSKGQRRAVTQFLYSMLSLGIVCEPEDEEFIPLSKDNGAELAVWKPSVIQKAHIEYVNKEVENEPSEESNVESSTSTSNVSTTKEADKDSEVKMYGSAKDLILGFASKK